MHGGVAPDPDAGTQQVPGEPPPAARTHLSASQHGILHHVVISPIICLGLLLGLPEGQAPNELVKCPDGRSRLGGLLGLLLIWEAGWGSNCGCDGQERRCTAAPDLPAWLSLKRGA